MRTYKTITDKLPHIYKSHNYLSSIKSHSTKQTLIVLSLVKGCDSTHSLVAHRLAWSQVCVCVCATPSNLFHITNIYTTKHFSQYWCKHYPKLLKYVLGMCCAYVCRSIFQSLALHYWHPIIFLLGHFCFTPTICWAKLHVSLPSLTIINTRTNLV